jgi:hypothetical protein
MLMCQQQALLLVLPWLHAPALLLLLLLLFLLLTV